MFKKVFLVYFLFFSLIFSLTLINDVKAEYTQENIILASDGDTYDYFGGAIDSEGNWIVVAAMGKNNLSGVVYVYHWNGLSWEEFQVLTASDFSTYSRYGSSVSISGDYIVVGASGDDSAVLDGGAVYVYHWNGFNWGNEQKIISPDLDVEDYFGSSVTIEGNNLAISAPLNDNNGIENSGSLYTYRLDNDIWNFKSKITASELSLNGRLGSSLDMSGDYIVSGATGDNSYSGKVFIYHWDGLNWEEKQILSPYDLDSSDYFGSDVSISGDYLVVSSSGDDDIANDAGAVRMYRLNGGIWEEIQKVIPFDGVNFDYFGSRVYLKGSLLTIFSPSDDFFGEGRPAEVYVYKYNGMNFTWDYQEKLKASNVSNSNQFGHGMSSSGGQLLIGASGDTNINGSFAGAVYSFVNSLNNAPVISNLSVTPYIDGTGNVEINLALIDIDADPNKISYHYEKGSCGTYSNQAMASLSMSSDNSGNVMVVDNEALNISTDSINNVTSIWNSKEDVPNADGLYCIYVFSSDGTINSNILKTTVVLDNISPGGTGITSFVTASTTLTPNWSISLNATQYTVSSTAGNYTTAYTNYLYGGLIPNTRYYFQVKSADNYGNSSYYSTIMSSYTDPALPTITSVVVNGQTSVKVSWSNNGNPDGTVYLVSNNKSSVLNKTTTSTEVVVDNLTPNTTYYFKVKAISASGNSLQDTSYTEYSDGVTTDDTTSFVDFNSINDEKSSFQRQGKKESQKILTKKNKIIDQRDLIINQLQTRSYLGISDKVVDNFYFKRNKQKD